MTLETLPAVLTRDETAQLLGVDPSTVSLWTRDGRLTAIGYGRNRRWPLATIRAYLYNRRAA
jgi:excisionase family DNA binding protein